LSTPVLHCIREASERQSYPRSAPATVPRASSSLPPHASTYWAGWVWPAESVGLAAAASAKAGERGIPDPSRRVLTGCSRALRSSGVERAAFADSLPEFGPRSYGKHVQYSSHITVSTVRSDRQGHPADSLKMTWLVFPCPSPSNLHFAAASHERLLGSFSQASVPPSFPMRRQGPQPASRKRTTSKSRACCPLIRTLL
jgi:hypothetical protein